MNNHTLKFPSLILAPKNSRLPLWLGSGEALIDKREMRFGIEPEFSISRVFSSKQPELDGAIEVRRWVEEGKFEAISHRIVLIDTFETPKTIWFGGESPGNHIMVPDALHTYYMDFFMLGLANTLHPDEFPEPAGLAISKKEYEDYGAIESSLYHKQLLPKPMGTAEKIPTFKKKKLRTCAPCVDNNKLFWISGIALYTPEIYRLGWVCKTGNYADFAGIDLPEAVEAVRALPEGERKEAALYYLAGAYAMGFLNFVDGMIKLDSFKDETIGWLVNTPLPKLIGQFAESLKSKMNAIESSDFVTLLKSCPRDIIGRIRTDP